MVLGASESDDTRHMFRQTEVEQPGNFGPTPAHRKSISLLTETGAQGDWFKETG